MEKSLFTKKANFDEIRKQASINMDILADVISKSNNTKLAKAFNEAAYYVDIMNCLSSSNTDTFTDLSNINIKRIN